MKHVAPVRAFVTAMWLRAVVACGHSFRPQKLPDGSSRTRARRRHGV
jgi:hypothetical protein